MGDWFESNQTATVRKIEMEEWSHSLKVGTAFKEEMVVWLCFRKASMGVESDTGRIKVKG